jgi:hypothetical protein
MAKLSSAELAKREDVIMKMKKNKRSLVKRYGPDAEKVMYGRATNIAKKVAESEMEKTNLKELVRAALMQEKKKPFPDLTGDGKVTKADILKARGVDLKEEISLQIGDTITINPEAFPSFEFPKGTRGKIIDINKADYASDDIVYRVKIYHIDGQGDPATELYVEDSNQYLGEDMDLGHTDNEPHMLKGDLYRIGKYAMELYQMVDEFEGQGEVDFPHWWQAKIINAREAIESAKHYLDFETKEPQIDAMVGAIDMSGALDNIGVEDEIEEGIHDRDITSAPHTNVKGEMGAYDPAKRAASLKRLANFGSKKKDEEIEEGLPKGYWSKKIEGGVDESYEALVKKIKGQGKSEKAAKAIAGAVASYKAKGGGKGPTAKQKARG